MNWNEELFYSEHELLLKFPTLMQNFDEILSKEQICTKEVTCSPGNIVTSFRIVSKKDFDRVVMKYLLVQQ